MLHITKIQKHGWLFTILFKPCTKSFAFAQQQPTFLLDKLEPDQSICTNVADTIVHITYWIRFVGSRF